MCFRLADSSAAAGEVSNLNTQVAHLRAAIDATQGRAQRLKARTIEDVGSLTLSMGNTGNANGSGGAGGSSSSAAPTGGISLAQLTAKVAEVYVRSGFDADKSIGTLQMLTNIESKLEELLMAIDSMSPEFVESMEKGREKERRKVARDDKLQTQQKEHEARMARALERASAPVFKKQGKPVMYRSQPPKKRVEAVKDVGADEEAELQAYLARDLI